MATPGCGEAAACRWRPVLLAVAPGIASRNSRALTKRIDPLRERVNRPLRGVLPPDVAKLEGVAPEVVELWLLLTAGSAAGWMRSIQSQHISVGANRRV